MDETIFNFDRKKSNTIYWVLGGFAVLVGIAVAAGKKTKPEAVKKEVKPKEKPKSVTV